MDILKNELRFKKRLQSLPAKTIHLYLNSAEELINNTNFSGPEPFTLSDSAQEYLEKCAREITINYKIKLEIHFRNNTVPSNIDCAEIIHTFYKNQLDHKISENLNGTKNGRLKLFLGFLFLASCHGVSLLLGIIKDSSLTKLLQDSFEIMGWVAIWEPTSYLLFTKRQERKIISDYFQLKYSEISFDVNDNA